MSYQAYNNEIEIESVLLLDEDGKQLLDLATQTVSGKIALEYITFTESLSSPMVDGSLIYDSTKGEYEALQLNGKETIKIVAKTATKENDNDDSSSVEFPEFAIYNFQDSSNVSDTNKTPEGGVVRKLTINFCSKEAKELFENEDLIPDGFIGKIASGLTFEEESVEENAESSLFEDEEEKEPTLIDKRGLVEIISENIDGGIDAEPTLNDVWIKPRLISMPYRKELENMTPLQMLNYCKDYSVSQDNPIAVNYFFWQDLGGWHFKSADKMLLDYKNKDDLKTFTTSSNIIGKTRIYGFDVISDFSFYSSISNKSLYLFYDRIEPDYFSSPYARLMDDREKFSSKKIIYNYKDVYERGLTTVESLDPFHYISKEEIGLLENEKLRVNDIIFGYHNERAYNDQDKIRSVLLRGNELGSGISGPEEQDGSDEEASIYKFLEQEEEQESSGSSGPKQNNLAHFNVYEPNSWQAMFDCMDMDGEILKRIVKDIKQPTFEAKKKYRDMLAYKEQWNIYKYSVCCTSPETEDDGFMAIIKGYKTVGRNIYRYAWHEAVFIPKAELAIFAGLTVEPPTYADDIITLNNRTIWPQNQPSTITFKKFGTTFIPETIGDISGEIFIGGSTCGITFESKNSVARALENYLACDVDFGEGASAGITFNFHNDQYSPFIVVEKPNGASGRLDNYSSAYNLNEVLNRTVYDESEYPALVGGISGGSEGEDTSVGNSGPDGVLYFQYQKDNAALRMPISPPTNDETDVAVGPGINANKDYTDYPIGFDSMPVGTYKRIAKDSEGAPVLSSDGSSVECDPIPLGQVVKIKSLKTADLPLYGIDIKNAGTNTIFYFHATNAQDGNCTTLIDCGVGNPTIDLTSNINDETSATVLEAPEIVDDTIIASDGTTTTASGSGTYSTPASTPTTTTQDSDSSPSSPSFSNGY